jgi:hypothetical protein
MGANTKTAARRTRKSTGNGARRYRAHELRLADGGLLRLHADGTIERRAGDGSTVSSSQPGTPEWAALSIRFGLQPEPITVAPQLGRVADNELP